MTFDINKAARIMRVGDELSGTNRKLREAVYSFIEWLFQALGEEEGLPGEKLGWIFGRDKENNQQIRVSFGMDVGGWYYVTTHSKKPHMKSIVLFCQTLAGPEGERLLTWLENQTRERSRFLIALQSGIEAFRSSIVGQSS